MKINFIGKNIDVTTALKTVTTEKLEKLERRFSNIGQVQVTFHLEGVNHIAEATVHISGTDLHATAKSEDMYNAIDELVDKLITQITKYKEKQTDHR